MTWWYLFFALGLLSVLITAILYRGDD